MYTLDQATLLACARPGDEARRAAADPPRRNAGRGEDRAGDATSARRPTFLDSIKFWAPVTLAAHGIWVSPEEVSMLAARGVGISHNPESNMKLASGTAPVPAYLKAGAKLGLGTDGAASNNDLDMFEAMRQAAFLHKLVSNDPRVVPAQRSAGDGDDRRRPRARDGTAARIARSREACRPASRPHRPRRARCRCTTRSRTSSTRRTATTWC